MSVRLFVGNLSYDVAESELKELFAEAGAVTQVRIPLDRETGRPRGFAFVDLEAREQGEEAIRRFDQQIFKGRPLGVSEALPQVEGSRGPSRGPGGAAPAPPSRDPSGPAPERRVRTFGEDASPRARRKPERWATKAPSGPIKETGGENPFDGYDEPDDDDSAFDERPFWELADSDDAGA